MTELHAQVQGDPALMAQVYKAQEAYLRAQEAASHTQSPTTTKGPIPLENHNTMENHNMQEHSTYAPQENYSMNALTTQGTKLVPAVLEDHVNGVTNNTKPTPSKAKSTKNKCPLTRAERRQLLTKLHSMNDWNAVIVDGPNVGRYLVRVEQPQPGDMPIVIADERRLRVRFAKPLVLGGKKVSLFDAWRNFKKVREIKGIIFAPGTTVPMPGFYNLWQGFAVKPVEGDCSLYLQHIKDVIASGNEAHYRYILAYMADAVQHPAEKPGVALVLRGDEGVGKGMFISGFGALFGRHFKHLRHSSQLVGKFNAHLQDAIVVFADEALWGGDRQLEGTLKGLITEKEMQVEPKGKDAYTVKNHVHLMVAANEDWPVPAGKDARRFCVLDVPPTHKDDIDYFAAIVKEMDHGGREALLYMLQHYDTTQVDLRIVPKTDALLEVKQHSMRPIEQFWQNCLENSANRTGIPGWFPEVRTTEFLADFAAFATRTSDRSTATHVGMALKKLLPAGFQKCELTRGGVTGMYYLFPPYWGCVRKFEAILGHTLTLSSVMDEVPVDTAVQADAAEDAGD